MAMVDLFDWLDEFSRPGVLWYAKRLSGNDTLANGSHQAGPYMPRDMLFRVFPSLDRPEAENPDHRFDVYIDSHADHQNARAIWYNNRLRGGTRNEARVTGFGGRSSALLDPDSTGALALFAFVLAEGGDARQCHVWVCRHAIEEDLIEERTGVIEPGTHLVWAPADGAPPDLFATAPARTASCVLRPEDMPPGWLVKFPTGEEIVRRAVEMRRVAGLDPDERLVRRRDCEFEIFQSVEEAIELPVIRAGFGSVAEFIARAQTVLQRRKSRSGRSLELHAREIFVEEGLVQGRDFDHQAVSEMGKTPDFLFPSASAYASPDFPAARLRMLAVKTTFRDRWRQVIDEAGRIPVKHLLTLQEGVSESQFAQITEAGLRLVVPTALHSSYPSAIRPALVSLEGFITDLRMLGPR